MIVGDSNMSEWTTFMKVGITDLVLRMVEANTVMRDLSLENPIRAIREISHDTTCTRTVKLANGRELSALEIQTEYHEKTARFIERRGADDTSTLLLEEWGDGARRAPRRRARAAGPQGRLGHEARDDRAVHGQARPPARHRRGSRCSTSPTTT